LEKDIMALAKVSVKNATESSTGARPHGAASKAGKRYVSKRMFENDFLERFSHVHPSIPAIVFLPIVLGLFVLASREESLSLLRCSVLGAAGLLVWTFTEYFLHRFVFHAELPGKLGARIHFMMHGVHHEDPQDPSRLVMPPAVALPLSFLFYLGFKALLGPVDVLPFFAFFLVGYLAYDYTHYYIHHAMPRTRWGKLIKASHMGHHYVSPDSRWGVSTPLWDVVFGTLHSVKRAAPQTR
jgi:sterol desaturase/sphingolipid hydroxylase (fatty acid hydroxylase superfamily)